MEAKLYCTNCEKEQDAVIITKIETLKVKGKDITCTVMVKKCTVCNEEILDRELDNKSLLSFYDEYRKQENLLQSKEIGVIRSKYSLSQVSFSKLLGFGEKTITRYENGAIQDLCHDNLIRLMDSYDSFINLWNTRKHCLSEKEISRVEAILNQNKITKMDFVYRKCDMYNTSSSYIKFPGGFKNAG